MEKVVSNFEFKFILKKGTKEYDLSLADSITDAWTTNTTDVIRYSYKGVIGKISTGANFQVTVTGINDQNNDTYKLFKSLYGGDLLNLQGFKLEMTWPLADDETTPQKLSCDAALSFSAGFAAAANDLSRFSVDIFANGPITVTQAVLKPALSTVATTKALGEIRFDDAKTIANGIVAQAVIEQNTELTINDFWIDQEDVHWNLDTNKGTALAKAAGNKYSGEVTFTFTLNPDDPNRQAED